MGALVGGFIGFAALGIDTPFRDLPERWALYPLGGAVIGYVVGGVVGDVSWRGY